MSDQIIDGVMAQAIQTNAFRTDRLLAWIVMWDQPNYPAQFTARLITDEATLYILRSDTLAGLHVQLPLGLVQGERQPGDPPGMVEIWSAP
jgi:hypothetical protein